jgi:hypothetical protein
MCRRSKGIDPPHFLLNTHLCRHTHNHLDDGDFPNVATPVQTPRRILYGAATSSLELVGTRSDARSLALAPTDGTAATCSAGGCTSPVPPYATAATRPAGGRHEPNDDAVTNLDFDFSVTPVAPLAGKNTSRPAGAGDHPAHPTVLESFAAAINKLPDLEEPVGSYVWRETIIQHAQRADTALADFHCELDTRFSPADALPDSCANLKDSCIDLRTTVTTNSSDLVSLMIALMGQTHARVLTLEAATAKNEADVVTTMTALAATAAAHAMTAAAVAEFGTTVTDPSMTTLDATLAP